MLLKNQVLNKLLDISDFFIDKLILFYNLHLTINTLGECVFLMYSYNESVNICHLLHLLSFNPRYFRNMWLYIKNFRMRC